MCENLQLAIPGCSTFLHPGQRIKIGRFSTTMWVVEYGWYSWANNRPVCGWYLRDAADITTIKPLQLPDLDDIYFIQS